MDVSELFWTASFEDLKRGYLQENNAYVCLLCGERIERGIVYNENEVFYKARKYMSIHIKKVHHSVFYHLNSLDKKLTGLTEHQSNLLRLFYEGKSDREIQTEMSIGSASTIRNHRFALREKERQSRIYGVMAELLNDKTRNFESDINVPKIPTVSDGFTSIPQKENEVLLQKLFPQGPEGPLKTFSLKEKHKFIVLREVIKRFLPNQIYTEKEVNLVLSNVYDDFVTLRRYLIEFGFLERTPDGSKYWQRISSERSEEGTMDRREALKQQYKETKIDAGIYQIKNTKNQRLLIESTMNLKTMTGKQFTLEMGSYQNKQLQNEWNEFGKDAFVFEVLEILEIPESGYFDAKDSLKKLKEKWLDKLQPYGDRGYNIKKLVKDRTLYS